MKKLLLLAASASMLALAGCRSTTPGLIFSLDFESEQEVLNPAFGPAGTLRRQKPLTFADGKEGKALRVEAGGTLLSYTLPTNFLGKTGCVEFWAKLESGKKDYGCADPCFYCIKFYNNEENLVQFTSNNGVGCRGLYGRMVHHERVTYQGFSHQCSYAPILGKDISGWHHYAFVWNIDGVTGYLTKDGKTTPAVMYVDGKAHCDVNLMPAEGPKDSVASLVNTAAKGAELGIPLTRGRSASPYLIDSFRIWDFDKLPPAPDGK